MTNPVDECLELMDKESAFPMGRAGFMRGMTDAIRDRLPTMTGHAGGNALGGKMMDLAAQHGAKAVAIAAAAAATAAGVGLAKMREARKQKETFDQMLQLHPDLVDHQSNNPELFNATYRSIQRLMPQYASDPLISGKIMATAMDSGTPGGAGGVLYSSFKPLDVSQGNNRLNASFGAPVGPLSFKAGPFQLG